MQPREQQCPKPAPHPRTTLTLAVVATLGILPPGCDAPEDRGDYRDSMHERDEGVEIHGELAAEQTTELASGESVLNAEETEDSAAGPRSQSVTTPPRAPVPLALENCFYDVNKTTTVGATEVAAGNCGVNGAITACMCNSTQSDRYIRSMFPTEADGSGVDDGQSQALAGSCKCRFSGGLSSGNTYEAYALCCVIN